MLTAGYLGLMQVEEEPGVWTEICTVHPDEWEHAKTIVANKRMRDLPSLDGKNFRVTMQYDPTYTVRSGTVIWPQE